MLIKRELFEQVGNIFYAVAKELRINELQVSELKLLINRDWVDSNGKYLSEHVVSAEAHYILLTIDTLFAGNGSAQEAYDQFIRFFNANTSLFTHEIKHNILETINEVELLFGEGKRSSFAKKIRSIFQPVVFNVL